MKKILFTVAMSCIAVAGFANLNGTGYYRVMNYGSSRWANLIDNEAQVDFISGSADLHALQLTNDKEAILSEPGSVVLITQASNNQYDVAAQGVSLESLVNQRISILANGDGADGQSLYRIFATYKGITKYIGDANIITSQEYGKASINVNDMNFNRWYILPIDVNSDNYFGAVPNVSAGNNLYTTLFTSFAYTPYSDGVKAYYINRVGYGMAEMVEVTGAVPPGCPVIIECAGENVSDNKLEILESQEALPANSLTGVYFNYDSSSKTNHVKYDPNTMRVLGTCSDGSLGFVTSDIDYIPANTAYLKVAPGSLPEIKCVSTEEYVENLPEAPESYYLNEEGNIILPQGDDVYTGTFQIPAQENSADLKIRFYASSSNGEEGFLGAYNADVNLEPNSTATLPFSYDSPYYWIIPNWLGGSISVTIDLKNQSVAFNTEMAGVDSLVASDHNLVFNGETVYCEGAKQITVYNLAGQKLAYVKGNSLDISNLPKGVYTVVANGKAVKIQK